MNSTPACSKALVIKSSVLILAEGNPLPASILLIVATPTLAMPDKSATDILNKALAALNCSLEINLIRPYNDPFGITKGD